MILSDRDIKKRLEKDLVIKPLDLKEQLGPSSIDLKLGDEFQVFKLSDHSIIDPKNYDDKELYRRETESTSIIENTYTTKYKMKKSFIIHITTHIASSLGSALLTCFLFLKKSSLP